MKHKNSAVAAAAGVLGRMTSAKKAAGARRNGLLGGGPPKYQPGMSVTVRPGAPVALVGRSGTVSAYLGRTRYRVAVDGQEYELRSWWISLKEERS